MLKNNCCCSFLLKLFKKQDEYYRTVDSTTHGTNYLKCIKYADAEEYIPAISKGKVVKVYNDRTISIAAAFDTDSSVPPKIYRFSIWLYNVSNIESYQNEAEIVRNNLSARILGKMVDVKNINVDDNGRIVADVFCEEEYINGWVIETRDIIKLNTI